MMRKDRTVNVHFFYRNIEKTNIVSMQTMYFTYDNLCLIMDIQKGEFTWMH